MSIVNQCILQCLSDGALRTFTEIRKYPTLARRTDAAIARSLRKLLASRYIEKVFLKPEMPNQWRIGGANGSYRITTRGLNVYRSAKERASNKLAIWRARISLPLPAESLEGLSAELKEPYALITIYSDKMKEQDLSVFEYEDLAPLITKFITAVARKNFPSMLTGSLHDDRVNFRFIPSDERRRPIERDRHSRFATWLQTAHSMKFGVYLEFDGYEWIESVDWSRVRELAKQKDLEDETIWSTFLRHLPQIRDAYTKRKVDDENDEDLRLPAPDEEFLRSVHEVSKEMREYEELENMFRWYLKNRTETTHKVSSGTNNV